MASYWIDYEAVFSSISAGLVVDPVRNHIELGVYSIPYSFHIVSISVMKSYHIYHRPRVNGRPIQYENKSDSS